MFKSLTRSKSWKIGGGNPAAQDEFATHGPDDPFPGGPGIVSSVSQPTTHSRDKTAAIPSAADFPLGNPYLDRPLPAPPVAKVKMPERPRTSGGPGSKSSTKSDFSSFGKFDKRVSRDDMFLRSKPSTGGYQPFVPNRGQLPTPETSPRSVQQPIAPRLVRAPTPESFEGAEDSTIGMALGSPGQPPAGWNQRGLQIPRQAGPNPVSPAASDMSTESTYYLSQKPKVEQKKSGWRLFGRFGSKKQPENAAVSISEPNQLKGAPKMTPPPLPPKSETPTRSNTTRGVPKHKPIIIRSNTEPFAEAPEAKPPKTPKFKKFRQERQDSSNGFGNIPIGITVDAPSDPASSNNPNMPPRLGDGPMLNVEIPSVTMERYSVMFGSVLGQQQTASSLLARRQATLERLKTISDAVIAEEEAKEQIKLGRRATSPNPTRSPSFNLFPLPPSNPQTQSTIVPAIRPALSPRSRSFTSPATLPSPSKASFERPHFNHLKDSAKGNPNARLTISTLAKAREQVPPKPLPQPQLDPANSFHFGPGESGLILESPTDFDEDDDEGGDVNEIIVTRSSKPMMHSPQWQMMTAPEAAPSSASSISSNAKRDPPSSASSAQTHVTKPSLEIDENDSKLRDAVQISIARQISVSRQQQKLLQPLSNRRRPSASPDGTKTSPIRQIPMGKNERLAETKMLTPTLINPQEPFRSPNGVVHGHIHRKSERVVLEEA